MLIISRRTDESLFVGDEVKITVLGVKGNQVKIGIDAPKDVAVHREEIYERIIDSDTSTDEEDVNTNKSLEPT